MTRLVRWGPWFVLLAVAVVSLAIGVHRPSHPTLQQRATQLAGEVRCPVCSGETAAQSQAPEAAQVRQEITSELAAGRSPSAILDGLVGDFGPGILEKPQTHGVSLLVWVLPVVAFAAGATGLGVAFAGWRRRPRATPDEADRDRVAAALALGPERPGVEGALSGVGGPEPPPASGHE